MPGTESWEGGMLERNELGNATGLLDALRLRPRGVVFHVVRAVGEAVHLEAMNAVGEELLRGTKQPLCEWSLVERVQPLAREEEPPEITFAEGSRFHGRTSERCSKGRGEDLQGFLERRPGPL